MKLVLAMALFIAVSPLEARSQGEGINSQATPLKAALAIVRDLCLG